MALNIAGHESEEPAILSELGRVGQGFGLQDAVVPFVADVEVRVGTFVPPGPVFFLGDATAMIGREGTGRERGSPALGRLRGGLKDCMLAPGQFERRREVRLCVEGL